MKRSLGFWSTYSLVVGIMIGNGIFMLPSLLAPYGSMSILGWIFAGGGTIFLAMVLGSLAKRLPKVGGPYAYTRAAFGDLPGFLVGWGYWISVWSAVSAGAVAFTGYLGSLIPWVTSGPFSSGLTAVATIWIITGINLAGVRSAGIFQVITTLLKLLPLFAIAAGGLLLGDVTEIPARNPTDDPLPLVIASMIMLTMWAFVGFEGATIPADDIKNPEKTIPQALIWGTITATLVYVISTIGVMAVIPVSELAVSTSPFADAASVIFGPWGGGLVAIGALVSIIGSTNGNTLVVGMMPRAIAMDGFFPQRFAGLNSAGAPAFALVVSGLLSSVLIALNYTKGLIAAFELLILLSTLCTLLPYVAASAAELALLRKDRQIEKSSSQIKSGLIALGALSFALFAIVGSGLEVSLYGIILLAAGLPVYFYSNRKKDNARRDG